MQVALIDITLATNIGAIQSWLDANAGVTIKHTLLAERRYLIIFYEPAV